MESNDRPQDTPPETPYGIELLLLLKAEPYSGTAVFKLVPLGADGSTPIMERRSVRLPLTCTTMLEYIGFGTNGAYRHGNRTFQSLGIEKTDDPLTLKGIGEAVLTFEEITDPELLKAMLDDGWIITDPDQVRRQKWPFPEEAIAAAEQRIAKKKEEAA